jgi:hypothetical protein
MLTPPRHLTVAERNAWAWILRNAIPSSIQPKDAIWLELIACRLAAFRFGKLNARDIQVLKKHLLRVGIELEKATDKD